MQETINITERFDQLMARRKVSEMSKAKRLESMSKRHGVYFGAYKFYYEELK